MPIVVRRVRARCRHTNFEIFKMREKDIPVDVLELKDKIVAFAWEPKVRSLVVVVVVSSRSRSSVCDACGAGQADVHHSRRRLAAGRVVLRGALPGARASRRVNLALQVEKKGVILLTKLDKRPANTIVW